MPESQIKVVLNPDTPPTGSDLSIVNAARRSFNTRSEWENEEDLWVTSTIPCGPNGELMLVKHEMANPFVKPVLKEKDKRLLQFLARGMTCDDFEGFLTNVSNADMGCNWEKSQGDCNKLKELLWSWRNTPTHDTPFNHTFISFEVKAPIFVRAQVVKNEYLIMSEFSRRYITNDIEFYEPDVWRVQSKDKKQGSSGEHPLFNHGKGTGYRAEEYERNQDALNFYLRLVDMGVAIEQSRMVLPQSTMTEWTWSGTLGAFAKMCTLRCHPEAQYETRLLANQVYEYLKVYWPVGAPALVEGVK